MHALQPLKIGALELDFPVVQAALSGYSDAAMRTVARRLGASYTLCEVMLDRFLLELRNRGKNRHLLRVTAEQYPVGGQLMGADPEQFGPAARRLVDAGFHVVDINFGCPVKKVVGKCRGGYHLSQPRQALDIVARVRDAVPHGIPVTVKMRRGIDGSDTSRENFFQIFDGAFARGAAAVTVHGRTVQQRYDGPSCWEFLKQVKHHAGSRTVLGSGDLFSAADCLRMLRTTGVDGVSVARGAIGNPWIFGQARALARGEPLPPPPSVRQQRDVICAHFRLAQQDYGDARCVAVIRKFGIKYAKLHPQATQVRNAFVRVKDPAEGYRVLDAWYADDAPGCYPLVDETNGARGPFRASGDTVQGDGSRAHSVQPRERRCSFALTEAQGRREQIKALRQGIR